MSKTPKREVLGLSKISYKYQVTIPKQVREKFQLKEGDMLIFVEEDNKLTVAKSTTILS